MTLAEEQAKEARPAQSGPAYLSSIVALGLGVVLAVGVSALFGVLGWGGELASQTAGAASGAAPLIIDGIRQRRRQRRAQGSGPSLRALTRGLFYRPKLFIASAFGFALLLVDSGAGLLVYRMSRRVIQLADGDQARWIAVYTLLGAVITLPTVVLGTYLMAVAAGHRLGERNRRWILLGMGIYAAVRISTVLASTPAPELGITGAIVVAGIIITLPLLTGIALLGARRARKTQAAYYAKLYFRRLTPADQEAALALLDESVAVRKP